MCIGRKVFITATLFAATLLLMLPTEAVASPVTATNAVLDSVGGTIFIPLQPSTSGILGDPLPGGGSVGLQAQTVSVGGTGTTLNGFVQFDLLFDLTPDIDPNNPDIIAGVIEISFKDLDFLPVEIPNRFNFREMLALQINGNAPLELDANNYSDFILGPPPYPTNNTTQTYAFDMKADLGVDSNQFEEISLAEEFTLTVALFSRLEHLRNISDPWRNTAEVVPGNDFGFSAVPEPAAMLLLASGGVLMLLRRRRQ